MFRRRSCTWAHAPLLLLWLAAATGCQSAAVQPATPRPAASGSPSLPGEGGGGPAPGGGPGLAIPDAGPAVATPPPGSQTCATEVHSAEKLPLDLLLLVDASGSMDEMSGSETKWAKVRTALGAFVKDPGSAGLGVGLSFFPRLAPADLRACAQDSDCTGVSAPTMRHPCRQAGICYAPGLPFGDRPCAPTAVNNIFNCPAGMECRPRGKCSVTGALCVQAGTACADDPTDVCQIVPGICAPMDEGCNVAKPGQLDVEMGDLPGQSAAVIAALTERKPDGSTPMARAADAALATLIARAQSQPNRRSALVLATDGLPNACGLGESLGAVTAQLERGRSARPTLPTYVVGVFSPTEIAEAQPALQQFATAGGTKTPFILTTGDDLNQRLLDALKEIRGLALACEYNIPAPQMGQIDFGKVNVRTNAAGPAGDLAYVGSADRCRADTGGWYYDGAPTSGPAPTPPASLPPQRLVICPASCARLQSDPAARVDLVFGCATRTID